MTIPVYEAESDRIDWHTGDRWKARVPEHIRSRWPEFSRLQRIQLYRWADLLASGEGL